MSVMDSTEEKYEEQITALKAELTYWKEIASDRVAVNIENAALTADFNQAEESRKTNAVMYERALSDNRSLTAENKRLTLKAANSLANNLCPDHRDKQGGKSCLACEIERLTNKNVRQAEEIARQLKVITVYEEYSPNLAEDTQDALQAEEEDTDD